MKPEKEKLRVVIAAGADKAFEYIANLLPVSEFMPAVRAKSAGEAKRLLSDGGADILIINTPLPDDFGIMLALDMSETNMGILLMVKNDVFSQVAYKVEDNGVFTLSKPLSAQYFYSALKLVSAYNKKLRKIEEKTKSLKEKMADIRVVNRAKWLLMEKLNLSEKDAHYYIEKQAMDLRIPRREVAGNIIRTYET